MPGLLTPASREPGAAMKHTAQELTNERVRGPREIDPKTLQTFFWKPRPHFARANEGPPRRLRWRADISIISIQAGEKKKPKMSTQACFGALLNEIGRDKRLCCNASFTTSPDRDSLDQASAPWGQPARCFAHQGPLVRHFKTNGIPSTFQLGVLAQGQHIEPRQWPGDESVILPSRRLASPMHPWRSGCLPMAHSMIRSSAAGPLERSTMPCLSECCASSRGATPFRASRWPRDGGRTSSLSAPTPTDRMAQDGPARLRAVPFLR